MVLTFVNIVENHKGVLIHLNFMTNYLIHTINEFVLICRLEGSV